MFVDGFRGSRGVEGGELNIEFVSDFFNKIGANQFATN